MEELKILFYRYGSICEPDFISSFRQLNIEVVEISREITEKNMPASKRVELVSAEIQNHSPAFVFSVNFFPAIAEVCHIYKVLYLCQTVDCPVLELFSKSIEYDTNRIFMFDRAQFEYFHRFNQEGTFHLPLAANVERFDQVIQGAAGDMGQLKESAGGITFVGSLYCEKNPMNQMELSDYTAGYLNGLCEASLKVYGYNFLEQALNHPCIQEIREKSGESSLFEIKDALPQLKSSAGEMERYITAHYYVGYFVAQQERIRTLNALAEHFTVDLFTRSDTSALKKVRVHGGVQTLTQMPLIFHQSRINLNMTIKPIQTGLPLRIFDILGCGGFVMTNFQEELADLFVIGEELEAYGSQEELIEKCAYYLAHEDERAKIALRGYEKVRKFDTYQERIKQMLRLVSKM